MNLENRWHDNIVKKIEEDNIFHKDWCGGYKIGKHPTYGWVAYNTDIAGFHQVFLCEMKYCPFCGEKLDV